MNLRQPWIVSRGARSSDTHAKTRERAGLHDGEDDTDVGLVLGVGIRLFR